MPYFKFRNMTLSTKIPQHVAIVMDGNGRWAQQRGLERVEGHRVGLESVKTIIGCCLEKGIAVLSLFAFSSENWTRPKDEVDFLMSLFLQALDKEIDELNAKEIRLVFTGERNDLSTELQQQMQAAQNTTAHNQRLTVNVVVNYGGKWDIVQAARKLIQAVEDQRIAIDEVDENLFASYLDTHGLVDPDLFIRTSGELRISNFFLWQLAYSELYFSETCWPDFREEAFEAALDSFAKRQRRYGSVQTHSLVVENQFSGVGNA